MADARERPCEPPPLPADLAARLASRRWHRDLVGESGCAVYRVAGDAGTSWLKHATGATVADLRDEMVRLAWLAPHLPVPAIEHYTERDGEAWLLTAGLPGQTACQILEADPASAPRIVDGLATFLRRWQALPAEQCPFNASHALRLAAADRRIAAGLVDEDDFDDARAGWTATQVRAALAAHLPLAPDPVVSHGDFSLDNLLIENGEVTGCIDVGRAGIADRWQDIAILWNCLGEFGEDAQARLFPALGLAAPDAAKLEFHLLLDELF